MKNVEPLEDIKITEQNVKFLGLTEHPVWGIFVRMVDEDIKKLDNISDLVIDQDRDDLIREIEVRYHTIEKLRGYIGTVISRAEEAKKDIETADNPIIKRY